MATYDEAVAATEYLQEALRLKPEALDTTDVTHAHVARRFIEQGAPLSAAIRAAVTASAMAVALRLGPEYATTEGWEIVSVTSGQVVA